MIFRQGSGDSARGLLGRLAAHLGATVLLILLIVSLCFVESTLAKSGGVFAWPQLPGGTATYSGKSGLQISLDTTWVGNRGYRPVQITLSSAKPVTGDVQITVRFHAGFWRNDNKSIATELDFEILQGNTSATATLVVPQYVDWDRYGWEVWIDGKKDKELCLTGWNFNQSNIGNTQHAALILPSKTGGMNPDQSLQQFSDDTIEALAATDSHLPDKWTGYTSLDIVVAYPDDLQRWQQTSPDQFAEMLRWVRTGGNLWIFKVGEEYEKLSQVDSSLGFRTGDQEETGLSPLEQRGWKNLQLQGQARQGPDALIALDGRLKIDSMEPSSDAKAEESFSSNFTSGSRRWFVARPYGMGTITAFCKSYYQHLPDEQSAMTAVQKSVLAERLNWSKRHGNFPGAENREFNNLLIPDVGAAPVFEFQLLISLFVLGIGPLNYWLLKRRQQLPLMLLTVPVAALAATILLFTYGILSDGFGARVRARSVTLLDQTTSEATCWARLSYYAGFAPSKGLQLPTDTAIYPIHPSRSSNSGFGQQASMDQRELQWGEQQSLTRGWLASRTPTQYQTITSRPTNKRLVFEQQDDVLKVTNELGVDVISLTVQDYDGNFLVAETIVAGESVQLEKSDLVVAMSRLRSLITENVPEFPAGFVDPQRSRRSWNSQQILGSFALSTNLMESQISSVISPLTEGWGNGAYIAVTAAGIELSLGIDDAVESSSFHIVRGSWSNE